MEDDKKSKGVTVFGTPKARFVWSLSAEKLLLKSKVMPPKKVVPQRKHRLANLSSAYSALRGLQTAEIRPFFVLASAKGSFISTVQASLKRIFLL